MNAHITGKKREEIFGLFVHLSISPVSHNTAQFDTQGKVGMAVSNAPGNNGRNDKLQQPVGAWTNRASSRRLYVILNSCSSSILTHSSQPSSFCSPAGQCWASAPCTRVWCPPWQPASSEGSWMTGRYVLGAPLACAVPSPRSACREVSGKGSQLTGTSLSQNYIRHRELTLAPGDRRWHQNRHLSPACWWWKGVPPLGGRTWKKFRLRGSSLPLPSFPSLLWLLLAVQTLRTDRKRRLFKNHKNTDSFWQKIEIIHFLCDLTGVLTSPTNNNNHSV